MQYISQLLHVGCSHLEYLLSQKFGRNIQLQQKCVAVHQFSKENPLLIASLCISFMILLFGLFLYTRKGGIKVFQAKLLAVKVITHDTKIFTFDLPKGWNKIGLNIGQHLTLTAEIDGKKQERKYTPISRADVKRNSFELLIKIYALGKMSSYVDRMKIGDKIQVSLPYGRFNYLGYKVFSIKETNGLSTLHKYDHIYLIGGGTGITPLYQIVQYVTEVESKIKAQEIQKIGPKITLLFANKTQSDILLKSEIEVFQNLNPNFKCYFSVDKAQSEDWNGFTGFIDEAKLKETLPADIKGIFFAACGPPPMVNLVEKLLTSKFNVEPNRFFRF